MTKNEISYKINIVGSPVRHITELVTQSTTLTSIIDTNAHQKYNTVIQIIKNQGGKIKVHYTYWKTLQAQQEATPQDKQEFYQNCNGIILVYDYGVRKSFDDIPDWLEEQKQYTPTTSSIILLGIKAEDPEFSNQMVRERIEELKIKQSYETSLSHPDILLKMGKFFISKIFRVGWVLKICVIGKNTEQCIAFGRLTADTINLPYFPTIGVDNPTKEIIIGETKVRLILWIIASYKHFKRLRKSYYEGAGACLILYDKGEPDSYSQVHHYFSEFREQVKEELLPIGLVAIKSAKQEEQITREEGQQLADQLGIMYYETSLSNKSQIEYILTEITKKAKALLQE